MIYLGEVSDIDKVLYVRLSEESESVQHYYYQPFLLGSTYNYLLVSKGLEILAKAEYGQDEYGCVIAHGHANALSLPITF